MNYYSLFVGIDVAMRKHDCCIMDKDSKILLKKFTFSNTLPGYQKFVDKLTAFTTAKACISLGMEVTGIYGDNLYERLKMDGFNVIMIQPDSVKNYREYKKLPKNNKLDARYITEILVIDEAVPISPQNKEYAEL